MKRELELESIYETTMQRAMAGWGRFAGGPTNQYGFKKDAEMPNFPDDYEMSDDPNVNKVRQEKLKRYGYRLAQNILGFPVESIHAWTITKLASAYEKLLDETEKSGSIEWDKLPEHQSDLLSYPVKEIKKELLRKIGNIN